MIWISFRSGWVIGFNGLPSPDAARVGEGVVGAVVGDGRLPGDHLTNDVDVFAGPGQRLRERLSVPALDHLGAGNTEAEYEAPTGEVVERQGGHPHRCRCAGRQLAQRGAEANGRGLGAPPAEGSQGVGPVGLGCPDRIEPEVFRFRYQFSAAFGGGPEPQYPSCRPSFMSFIAVTPSP